MMKIARTIDEVRAYRLERKHETWGLVPTMGYLHEGHRSLMRRARDENDQVAVSLFVNPTQFAPEEDFDAYPRDESSDLAQLEDEGVDLVFIPAIETIYPAGFQTKVMVTEITRFLEGASRPSHFEGVTTVVAKLFNIVQPHRAYFGQKDAQQVAVIKRMVMDLNFNLQIVVCPIVRESDGLAMSSRNARLTPEQRVAAPVLYQALSAGKREIDNGEKSGAAVRALMTEIVGKEPLARLDYVSAADPLTLQEVTEIGEHVLLSGAIFVGNVRLIDNVPI